MSATGRQRLTSWKEIAAHLGRDVRTVMRWHKERGLPICRIPGTSRRVIFAYSDELDAWARGELNAAEHANGAANPERLERRHRYTLRAIAAVALIGAVGAWTWRTAGANHSIHEVDVTSTHLRALTADGATLWTYTFREASNVEATEIADLDGDGELEVIASVARIWASGPRSSYLLALDRRGRPLWQRNADDTLTFGAGTYTAPWRGERLLVYRSGGVPLIAWAIRHDVWWPSVLAIFNGRGERVGAFVNSGWIRSVHASADGRYLLVGGINNARQGAAFAILDAAHPDAVSPEDAGSPFECLTCTAKSPLRYYVMPWTDVVDPAVSIPALRTGDPEVLPDGSVMLRAVADENIESIIELTPEFDIRNRRQSDGYWNWHAKLQRDGVLRHDRGACPFALGPSLLEWTAEHGWRDLTAPSGR